MTGKEPTNRHAVIGFEIFHGGPDHWSPKIVATSDLRDLLEVETSLSFHVPDASVLDSPQGVAIRGSLEHGVLWFPVPNYVKAFRECEGVLYSLSEHDGIHKTLLYPALSRLAMAPPGVHPLTEMVTRFVLGCRVQFALEGSQEDAIRITDQWLSEGLGHLKNLEWIYD